MTITIYHQHHYHHYYHHGLCHHSFHPAMNHPLPHAMCPLFVSLCDSVQTYSVIVPAEAVWQPDQLHFDDARTCLQGLSQPKIFTHRQWPLLKLNKTYRPQSPKKGYHVYYIYIMYMLKCKWGDLVQNRDSLLPGMILFVILKNKQKNTSFLC